MRTCTPGSGRADRARDALAVVGIGRVHERLAHPVAFENRVPGALAKLAMCFREQRGGPGHEQSDVRGSFAREGRMLQQSCVERGHAHHHRRFRQQPHHLVGVELRQKQHRAAGREHGVDRDEQAMHMEDRQGVQQHVVCRESPRLCERERIRREIRARQHRALRAAGGPGRIEQRCEIGLLRVCRRAGQLGFIVHELRQRDTTVGNTDCDLRIRIAQEVFDLGSRVRGIRRHEDSAQAQTRQIQRDRFR